MDLCLAAQADSFDDAERKLDERVLSYIEDAKTIDGGKWEQQLLSRPAPLTDRLHYHWRRFLEAIGFPSRTGRTRVKLYTGSRLVNITRAYLEP